MPAIKALITRSKLKPTCSPQVARIAPNYLLRRTSAFYFGCQCAGRARPWLVSRFPKFASPLRRPLMRRVRTVDTPHARRRWRSGGVDGPVAIVTDQARDLLRSHRAEHPHP